MLTNSQKEHLTYTAIWQIAALIALFIWGYSYILPGIDTIDLALVWANTSIEKYSTTETSWLSYDEIVSLAGSHPEYAELLKIMKSDIDGTRAAITKWVPSLKYIDWLKVAINNSTTDRDILSQQKQILNSIIPTLSPISGNIEEESIDLKWYIRFIESKIFKQFKFDGNMALGLDAVVPWTSADGVPENIGSIELQVSFKWTNKDIIDFIDFINTTGNPELLMNIGTGQNEKLPVDKVPTIMSNPLIIATSFSLENSIDAKKPDDANTWRATIRLYVRWIGKDDITYLRENIRIRDEDLWKKIAASIEGCKNKWALCGDTGKRLSDFSRKYQEYKLSTSSSIVVANASTGQITSLAQKAKVLKTLEAEYLEIITER